MDPDGRVTKIEVPDRSLIILLTAESQREVLRTSLFFGWGCHSVLRESIVSHCGVKKNNGCPIKKLRA